MPKSTKRTVNAPQESTPTLSSEHYSLWGTQTDDRLEVLPAECELTPEALAALAKSFWDRHVISEDARRDLRAKWAKERKKGLSEVTDVFRVTERSLMQLRRFMDVFGAVGYRGTVATTRQEVRPAHRILIRMIAALGSPVPKTTSTNVAARQSLDHDERVRRFELDRERAIDAINRFCSVLAPDCWTAYFRNRRLNRVQLLKAGGKIKFPEALHGFVWLNDLPTRLLFQETSSPFPAFPTRNGQSPIPDATGKFMKREGTDPKRVLAIRLAWEQTRLILFLSWQERDLRSDKAFLKQHPVTESIWKDLASARVGTRPIPSLEPSIRYLMGWFAASGIDLSEAWGKKTVVPPGVLIRQVAESASKSGESNQGESLSNAVKSFLDLPVHVSVHWANVEGTKLIFEFGEYEDSDTPRRPSFEIKEDDEKLVKRSVCALAALWKLPLLVPDLNRSISSSRTWRDLHYPRTGLNCTSEIAVPISEGSKTLCVLNVECTDEEEGGGLKPTHLRQAELVTHLFRPLCNVFESRGTQAEFLRHRLIRGHTRNAQQLLKHACNWFEDTLHTDFAFALIYDPRVRVFRPMGITVSRETATRFLRNNSERWNIERPGKCNLTLKPRGTRGKDASSIDDLHALVELAIATRLLPHRRRKTWRVFTDGAPLVAWHEHDHNGKARARFRVKGCRPEEDELVPEISQYCQIRYALPLASQPDAKADGVIWLAWRDQQKCSEIGLQKLNPTAFEQFIQPRIGRVVEAVAAAYAIFRYFDPDAATNPLPYG